MDEIRVILEREPVPGIIVLDTEESNEIRFQSDDLMIVVQAHDRDKPLPIASAESLGCIRVGANLSIDEFGVLNASEGSSGGAGEWGSISGLITDQIDLMAYLNSKAPIHSPIFTGIVTIPAGAIISSIWGASGLIKFKAGGNDRWTIGKDDTAEGGANAGADFTINRYSDIGAFLGTPLRISRNDGEVIVGNNLSVTVESDLVGVVYVNDDIGSPLFVSGFAGSGWKLDFNTDYSLTVDNLVVRKAMMVYELIINQIRGTNGSLWVSDSAKIDSVTGSACYIDTDEGNIYQPFAVNDIVRCQKFTGRGIKYYSAQVLSIDPAGEWFELNVIDGTDIPEAGDEIVRIGNTSDTSRQGALYLTSSDSGAPYMDILDEVTSYIFTNKTKVRLGKLSGITDIDFGGELSGYGLYSTNVYLKGKIVIASGSSGYSNLSDKPGYIGAPSGTGLFVSGDHMGYYTGGSWKTYIDNAGNFVLGDISGGGNGLLWNQATASMELKGTINITSASGYANISDKPGSLGDVNTLEGSKLTGIEDGATEGADWNANLSNIPGTLGTPSGSGLFLSSTHMGYYDSGAWKSYIDNSGNFQFGDIAGGNHGVSWNQSSGILSIKGVITATGGSIGGITIDSNSLYTGTKHATDGWSTSGYTFVNDGSFHTPNLYIDSDGEVGIRAKKIVMEYTISNDIAVAHDASAGVIASSYMRIKTITLGSNIKPNRTLRIQFKMKSTDGIAYVYARIYRGATPVGTERSNHSSIDITYTEDISGWNPGDEINLYGYASATPGGDACDFRVLGIHVAEENEVSGITS